MLKNKSFSQSDYVILLLPIRMFSFLAICLLTFIAAFLPGHEDAIATLMLGAHCFSAACFAVVSFQP